MNKALERLVEIIREESEGEGLSFLAKETLKNNDTVLHAIHVIKDWSSVGIVVYVDDILKDYVTGAIGGRQAAKMFLERISKSGGDNCECENEAKQFAKAILQNKGTLLENVHASVINTGWNTELLKNTPHKPFLDLAVIYEVHNHDHSMSVRVTNEMMEHFGISMSELEEYADRNKRAYVITDIAEVLPDAKEAEFGMYILSTADHFKGASVLMSPEFFEKCAKFTGSDLVVIPSSIHEVIVVPYDEEVGINTITNMIQMVNATELPMTDRLSDHAYFYKAGSNQVTMVKRGAEMETYRGMKHRHQEEFNALPIRAAFSNKQFSEMLKEWGIREKDAKNQVVSIGAGCFIRKADIPAYTRTVRRHKKELEEAIEADQTGKGFIYQMFYEEMANHEFGYTGDPEDTLNACGYTYKQVAEDQRLSAGWKMAEQKFIK